MDLNWAQIMRSSVDISWNSSCNNQRIQPLYEIPTRRIRLRRSSCIARGEFLTNPDANSVRYSRFPFERLSALIFHHFNPVASTRYRRGQNNASLRVTFIYSRNYTEICPNPGLFTEACILFKASNPVPLCYETRTIFNAVWINFLERHSARRESKLNCLGYPN